MRFAATHFCIKKWELKNQQRFFANFSIIIF